ncbi:L,D-transpeptidase family protein [Patescibacteria group bacterium]|nr:L,D-transpeptidase family protein [Patescibacteria group bacterium]MBU1034855.1 L,D-transpeptidase family protein [Patescibacteria group bacterium]MBU1629869.1 L,D-transpeptidase family protein [Patescibacteria group bacterium]MBU1907762.1 L,D-transpeptidase family protein [Patescibacteria group bacterium]
MLTQCIAADMHAGKKLHRALIYFVMSAMFFSFLPVANAATNWRPIPIKPEHTRPAKVKTWNSDFATTTGFDAFDASNSGGGFLAVGKFSNREQVQIAVGAGQMAEPLIKIFDADGRLQNSFYAYAKGFRGGVRIAAGDIDGDGVDEIIAAPGPGMQSAIRIFDALGRLKNGNGILAYNRGFVGGVRIAAGDLNSDGISEIITSPDSGGGPHVSIWNGKMENLGLDFFPFDALMREGVTVSVIKTPDGPSVVTAIESWEMPLVKTYIYDRNASRIVQASEFLAFDESSRNGVTTAAWDFDNDGFDEIAAVQNGGVEPQIKIFDRYGTFMAEFAPTDKDYSGSISLAEQHLNGRTLLLTVPTSPVVTGPTDAEKKIAVSLDEQRLYAYEHGRIAKTFLISSGVRSHPTPTAQTTVLKKAPIMDYRWYYGPNNPSNYNLPNVKYNLNILPHIYIHYAYWHNNFGNKMSHGCINVGLDDSAWIYNWAEIGTHVEIF